MKFRGHETFAIRKGWLSKGMKQVKVDGEVFLSKENNPMDVLGIGANMVKSLRYWLQAVGLTEEPKSGRRVQNFTEFGEKVFEHDRYIEETGTLQLLHYKLSCNKENAPSWYYFFNEFSGEISEDQFAKSISNWLVMQEQEPPSFRSIKDDFACIISTYLPRYKANPEKISPESNLDCPLAELGLLDYFKGTGKVYKKVTPPIKNFNPWIILGVIVEEAKGKSEIPLVELSQNPCNIGKIFNLDTVAMLDVLYSVEKLGEIKIIRTAGLDIIRLENPEYTFLDCVEHYYKSIKG